MVAYISSKDNKAVKLIRQLKKKSARAKNREFVAEGRKIVLEAIEYARQNIEYIVVTEEFCEKEAEAFAKISDSCEVIYKVPQGLFAEISDTDTPQGVLAVLKIPRHAFNDDAKAQSILVLDRVSEPGNMGTVIRTAEALGYDAVYMMSGCTDIYSPKTVRATMGSLFRMKFKADCSIDDIKALKNSGFVIAATTPSGDTALEKFQPSGKIAVVIGNEAHGVSEEILQAADFRIRINMDGMAESLNAAVAAGIVMHWIKAYGA